LRFTHLATHNELDFSGPYVTLSFPETGVLAIKAGAERRFRLNNGVAACHNGNLELRHSYTGQTWFGPAWNSYRVVLTRSTDGWLVAKWERIEWVLIGFFIPTRSLIREWYRFEPVSQSQQIQPETARP